MKKSIIIGVSVLLLASFLAFGYFSIPHYKLVPIEEAIKNSEQYKTKKVFIEGTPVLLYSVNTKSGLNQFYALKDSTGQIPIGVNLSGVTTQDSKIGLVGTIGKVCVHAVYNEANDAMVCDKEEIGLITKEQ